MRLLNLLKKSQLSEAEARSLLSAESNLGALRNPFRGVSVFQMQILLRLDELTTKKEPWTPFELEQLHPEPASTRGALTDNQRKSLSRAIIRLEERELVEVTRPNGGSRRRGVRIRLARMFVSRGVITTHGVAMRKISVKDHLKRLMDERA